MTKVEKSSRFGLTYKWKMEGINHREPQLYTKKYTGEKIELFRVGMKTAGKNHSSSNPAVLYLLATNLQRMGLKVLSVSFLKREFGNTDGTPWTRKKEIYMAQNNLTTEENDKTAGTQLFTSHLKLDETNLSSTEFEFKFTVYFTGTANNYRIQQFDIPKSRQLYPVRSSSKDQQLHKWVFAARSLVFAALFSSLSDEEIKSIPAHCTGYTIEQFIIFIYTGELVGMVSQELMKLSVEYQIKTQEDLCQAALQDALSADKIAVIATSQVDSGSHLICNEKNEPDEEFNEIHYTKNSHNVSIFTCTWDVQNLSVKENEKNIKMSVPFEYGGKQLFRACLEMTKSPNHPEKYTFSALKFLSFGHESICFNIFQVDCSIDGPEQNSFTHQRIIMNKTVPKDNKTSLKLFTCLLPTELATTISCPFVITFQAKLRSKVTSKYYNKPLDSTLSGEFWAAAVNRKMTDIEFLVDEEAFGAHRSLLSARSPVFAAMFASGMQEAETGRVRIEDVDPTTFQCFLKLLYTGMLESSDMDEELFTVADKYGVETLMKLYHPATQPADIDDSLL